MPPGEYAVSMWHDIDGDGHFSKEAAKNVMPLDGWGMVNAETLRAEPQFDQVKLQVPTKPLRRRIPGQYSPSSPK